MNDRDFTLVVPTTAPRGRCSFVQAVVLAATAMGTFALAGTTSCTSGKDTAYEAKAKVLRHVVNRKDASGTPLVVDVELDFPECPGEVKKLIRGGGAFAPCITKLAPGSDVTVKLVSAMKRNGRRSSRVVQVGECVREPDPTDSRSYDTVRMCEKVETDGIPVGFRCDMEPSEKLLAACPWLAK